MNKEPVSQNNLAEGLDSDESRSDKGSLEQDLLPEVPDDKANYGEKCSYPDDDIYELSEL